MHRHWWLPVMLLLVVTVATPAQAQEKGQVGVTMAFPAAFGLIFHPTGAIAIRPEFTFSTTSGDTTGATGSQVTTSNNAVGFGASALFYLRTWQDLKAYLTPRFAYARSTGSGTSSSSSSSSTANDYAVSGSVGAQYAVSRRFGVFAETGIAFSKTTTSGTFTSSVGSSGSGSASGHTWALRGGVGAILYF